MLGACCCLPPCYCWAVLQREIKFPISFGTIRNWTLIRSIVVKVAFKRMLCFPSQGFDPDRFRNSKDSVLLKALVTDTGLNPRTRDVV